MAKDCYLVIGHSAGLGAVVAEKLVNAGEQVVGISRTNKNVEHSAITGIYEDIENVDKDTVLDWLNMIGRLKGVIFCQRYRQKPGKQISALDEYATSVASVGVFIEAIESLWGIARPMDDESINIVLIGSSCAKSIGREQGWSYHAAKHALRGLMKWACIQTSANISVSLLSPSTYMRVGSEAYWKETRKNQEWIATTGRDLFSIEDVADLAVQILCQRTSMFNGMEFDLDRGMRWLQRDSD